MRIYRLTRTKLLPSLEIHQTLIPPKTSTNFNLFLTIILDDVNCR
ncbi:unnamed protein product [Brugia pahangi]|uniref:Uncharacterized protein n=1 Tax=Brugia pahangi TaxID=6280 RepID=A0A0N4TX67_BRUPA|nr:unnamed protein product [Brugia pahangi]